MHRHSSLLDRWLRQAPGIASLSTWLPSGVVRSSATSLASPPPTDHCTVDQKEATLDDINDLMYSAPATGGWGIRKKLRLAVVRPDLVGDWVPELNDVDVQSIYCHDNEHHFSWRCPQCGGIYSATPQSRLRKGAACCPSFSSMPAVSPSPPTASGSTPASSSEEGSRPSLAVSHPQLATRWDSARNQSLTPADVTADCWQSVWWLHEAPNNEKEGIEASKAQPSQNAVTTRQHHSFRRSVSAFVYDSRPWLSQATAMAQVEARQLEEIRKAVQLPDSVHRQLFSDHLYDESLERAMVEGTAAPEPAASDASWIVSGWRERAAPLLLFLQNRQTPEGEDASAAGVPVRPPLRVIQPHFYSNTIDYVTAARRAREDAAERYSKIVAECRRKASLSSGATAARPALPPATESIPQAPADESLASSYTLSEQEAALATVDLSLFYPQGDFASVPIASSDAVVPPDALAQRVVSSSTGRSLQLRFPHPTGLSPRHPMAALMNPEEVVAHYPAAHRRRGEASGGRFSTPRHPPRAKQWPRHETEGEVNYAALYADFEEPSPGRPSLVNDAVSALGHPQDGGHSPYDSEQYNSSESPFPWRQDAYTRVNRLGMRYAPPQRRTLQSPRRLQLDLFRAPITTEGDGTAVTAATQANAAEAATVIEGPRTPRKVARPRRNPKPE